MAWKRSSVRSRSGPPINQSFRSTSLPRLCQGRLIDLTEVRWRLDHTRRIFGEEVLIDCLGEDGPHVGANLQDSVLGMGFGQSVEVVLQSELVEVLQPDLFKLVHEISLNQILLDLGRLFSPVRLFQWQITVANKPSEDHSPVFYGSVFDGLPGKSDNLAFLLLSRLSLGHLRLQTERDGNRDCLRFIGLRIQSRPAKVPVPFFPANRDPALLIRLTNWFLSSVERNKRAPLFYGGFGLFSGVSVVWQRGVPLR